MREHMVACISAWMPCLSLSPLLLSQHMRLCLLPTPSSTLLPNGAHMLSLSEISIIITAHPCPSLSFSLFSFLYSSKEQPAPTKACCQYSERERGRERERERERPLVLSFWAVAAFGCFSSGFGHLHFALLLSCWQGCCSSPSIIIMSYWKSKVLPKLKKLMQKGPKAQAAEACRSFNKSKDAISKEIEENKEVLQPKVVAIYQSSNNEAKGLLKEPTDSGVTEFFEVVQNLLIELSDAGCPGAKSLSDVATKHGPSAMSKPIAFLLSKLTVFVADEKAPEPPKSKKRDVDLSVKADELAASVVEAPVAPKSEEPASNPTPVAAT